MPTFDAKTRIKTRVGIGKDAWAPDMGKLGKTSETDEALIHGTKKEEIDRNLISTVTMNRNFKTTVNFECTVGAMRKLQDAQYLHTTNGTLKRDVMGPSLYNHVGPTMCIFVTPLVESHSSPRQLSEPVVRMEQVTQAIESYMNAQEQKKLKTEVSLFKTEFIAGGKLEVNTSVAVSMSNVEVSINNMSFGLSMLEERSGSLENRLKPVKFSQNALEAEIKALETATGIKLSNLKLAANSISM
jgi:hypothetical protein